MQKLLTIAIPIYNGEYTIHETLDSIIPEIMTFGGLVEILICDNCSSDNSGLICKQYAQQYDFIRYILNKENIGFDRNIERLIELSISDFIWFLGDDDEIEYGGIEYVLNMIKKNDEYGGIVVNYSIIDRLREKVLKERYVKLTNDIEFKNADEFLSTLGIAPNFLSSVIINRKYYDKSCLSKYIGLNWFHIIVILSTIENKKSYFIAKPFVLNKGIYINGPNLANKGGVSVKILLDLLDFIGNLNIKSYAEGTKKKIIDQSLVYFFRKIPTARMYGLKFEYSILLSLYKKYKLRPQLYFIIFPLYILPKHFYKVIYVVREFIFRKLFNKK